MDLFPRPPGKGIQLVQAEGLGDLPGPVRTEVEEDDRVAVLNERQGLAVLLDHRRQHKLIGDAVVIGVLEGLHRVGLRHPFPLGQGHIAFLDPVPAVVPVHRVVAAMDGGHGPDPDLLHLRHQFLHEALGGGGRRVPPVQEGVDKDLLHALPFTEF